ncbi:MAG: DUF2442 domain-containing protein [Chitinivibrionia bacterium]|nr:DUF2442 domain-containing protein [Chitinivibrionia bacterium]
MRRLKIVKAEYNGEYKVELTFNDAAKKIVDFGVFLKEHPHPQHNRYKKRENFKKFKLESGNIVWGKNWDLIFPIEQLYEGKINA